VLGLTERRVQQLAEIGVVKKKLRGKYDLVESVQGYIAYMIEQEKPKRLDKDLEDARLKSARADLAELEFQVKTGVLLHREVVEDVWSRVIFALRARILSMDSKLANKVFGMKRKSEVKKVIKDFGHRILKEMSAIEIDMGKPSGDRDSDGKVGTREVGTTAEPDGQ